MLQHKIYQIIQFLLLTAMNKINISLKMKIFNYAHKQKNCGLR